MSTIKNKEDVVYDVNDDDLIPLVDNAGLIGKSVTPGQILKPAIKVNEDAAYTVNDDDLIPLVDNAGLIGKSVTPAQLLTNAMGTRFLTVGVGGLFTTIQDAVDFVETQESFIDTGNAVDYIDVGGGNFVGHAVGEWANGSNEITLAPTVGTTDLPGSTRQWLQAGTENRLYRLLANKKDAETILTDCIRIDTTITGATDQITIYYENLWTIFLLDSYYDEHITINDNVCIKFDGRGATWVAATLTGVLTKGVNFRYGVLEFGNLVILADGSGSFLDGNTGWNVANIIELRFLADCVIDTWQSDIMSPDVDIGAVFIEHLSVTSRPAIANAHLFFFSAKGTVQLGHVTWNVMGIGSGILEGDALLFDSTEARKLVIGHVEVNVEDGFDFLGNLAIVSGGRACKKIYIDNVTISSENAFANMDANGRISIVDMETFVVGTIQATSEVFISNCGFNLPNAPQDQIQIYRGHDATAAEVSIANCFGGAIIPGSTDTIANKNADAIQVVAYAAVVTPNANLGNTVSIRLTGDIIIGNPVNPQVGQKLRVVMKQDVFGGHTILVWGSEFIVNNLGVGSINETAIFDFEYIDLGPDGVKWVQTNTAQWI